MELKCDSTSAIVLATGDGSWRTKPLANKVCSIREQVEHGPVKVRHVNTAEQCVDAFAKFVQGGPQQALARKHLSVCLTRLAITLGGRLELLAA